MLNSAEHEIFPAHNVKMLTVVGILTFMSRKNSILGLSKPEKKPNFLIFSYLLAFEISCSAELSMTFFLLPQNLVSKGKTICSLINMTNLHI